MANNSVIANWTTVEVNEFVNLMVDNVKKGNNTNSTFNKSGWNDIKVRLEDTVGRPFTKEQLRNKMCKMHTDYSNFKKLLDTTGSGWNQITKTATADNKTVWAMAIQANPKWAKFKKNGLPHWPELQVIFGDSYARRDGSDCNTNDIIDMTLTEDPANDGQQTPDPLTPVGPSLDDIDETEDYRPTKHKLDKTPTGHRKRSLTSDMSNSFRTLDKFCAWRMGQVMASNDDDDDMIIIMYVTLLAAASVNTREPCRDSIFRGPMMDCIGVIDGTHIHAIIPMEDQTRYQNQKGITTQNVMCACSFDMYFTFANVGWEGSANDCRVFKSARSNPSFNFPHPPPDSGYANQTAYLTPFRGERYHLPDYRGAGRTPRTARELFNYRHSFLRNVIERTCGVLKNKILLLRQMHHFSVKTQGNIVIAFCGLHYYIRDEQKLDKDFSKLGGDETEPDPDELNPAPEEYNGPSSLSQREQPREMNDIRNQLTNVLARKHRLAPI
ncbi:uncharacterized protein LOC122665698 [Telopea speciosissima]|uniref:uncharacterized protein LOC122665698 n=1 Tax=Telopea speciosissima TaxID=54955 RepID=UPI001CC48DCE|nr:uncharacterized protein LOC122665698 [Telopea speciosissima]